MDDHIYKAAEKIIGAVIKNPPEFYNGQQCFKIPSTIFKEFEDVVRSYKFSKVDIIEEDEDFEEENNIGSPILFV